MLLPWYCIVFLCFPLSITNGKVSQTDPDYIPEAETAMARAIRLIIDKDPSKLYNLAKHVPDLEERMKQHQDLQLDPLNLFSMVKSLVDEWRYIRYSTDIEGNLKELPEHLRENLPAYEDVSQVATAIFRTQDTYQLSPADIVSISDKMNPESISARGLFLLGMVAYAQSDYYHALSWILEAKSHLENERNASMSELEMLAPLAVALNEQGNPMRATKETIRLLSLIEKEESADAIRSFTIAAYPKMKEIMENAANKQFENGPREEELVNVRNVSKGLHARTMMAFEDLCRGNRVKPSFKDPNFICYYKKTSPYLLLAPAKVEILNYEPDVLMFRGIITDSEISTLMSLAKRRLKRSSVINGSIPSISRVRTSSQYWLLNIEPIVKQLRNRVRAFTGLNMDFAELLQVARYGFGGFYFPHFDYINSEHLKQRGTNKSCDAVSSDRIATLMYYLNEPEGGGATVFPYLRLAIFPSKNDALFWFNLNRSGVGFNESLHGGCPVMSGLKWVANQWFREAGQELLRPCGLQQD